MQLGIVRIPISTDELDGQAGKKGPSLSRGQFTTGSCGLRHRAPHHRERPPPGDGFGPALSPIINGERRQCITSRYGPRWAVGRTRKAPPRGDRDGASLVWGTLMGNDAILLHSVGHCLDLCQSGTEKAPRAGVTQRGAVLPVHIAGRAGRIYHR